MPKLLLEIRMEVTVSNDFLEKFKLDEKGRCYGLVAGKYEGNGVLAGQIANQCFRNNSSSVSHVVAVENSEEGQPNGTD
tara:strand:+ start:103 stop:339 length:237 start_codon:yes stop_codon:yes gene_type:complete